MARKTEIKPEREYSQNIGKSIFLEIKYKYIGRAKRIENKPIHTAQLFSCS